MCTFAILSILEIAPARRSMIGQYHRAAGGGDCTGGGGDCTGPGHSQLAHIAAKPRPATTHCKAE